MTQTQAGPATERVDLAINELVDAVRADVESYMGMDLPSTREAYRKAAEDARAGLDAAILDALASESDR